MCNFYTMQTDFAPGAVSATATDGTNNYSMSIAADVWATGSDFHHVLFYLPACPAGVNQINFSMTSTGFIFALFVVEYSGLPANSAPTNTFQALLGSSGGTTWGPTPAYVANAFDLVICAVNAYEFTNSPTPSWTAGAGFTSVLSTVSFTDGGENWGGLLQHIDSTTGGSLTGSASFSTNVVGFYWGFIISFSGAAPLSSINEQGGTSGVMMGQVRTRSRSQYIA